MGYRQAFGLRKDDVVNQPSTETGYGLDDRLTQPAPRLNDPFGSDLARGFKGFRKKRSKHMRRELIRYLVAQVSFSDQKLADLVDKETDADIRAVWTPTAENFFGRVKAAYLDELWREFLDLKSDHPTATTFARLKKGEKAEKLENLFGDPDVRKAHGVSKAQALRIADWLPGCMK